MRNDKYWRRILAIPLSAKDAQGMPKKALALHAEMKTQEFIDFTVKDLNDRESKAKAAYQEEPAAAPPSCGAAIRSSWSAASTAIDDGLR